MHIYLPTAQVDRSGLASPHCCSTKTPVSPPYPCLASEHCLLCTDRWVLFWKLKPKLTAVQKPAATCPPQWLHSYAHPQLPVAAVQRMLGVNSWLQRQHPDASEGVLESLQTSVVQLRLLRPLWHVCESRVLIHSWQDHHMAAEARIYWRTVNAHPDPIQLLNTCRMLCVSS